MLRVLAAGGRLLRALAALAALVGFLVGVPWLLVQVIGWPLDWIGWAQPGTLPDLSDLSTALTTAWYDDKILALLATVGWILWALFCRDVLVEVIEASAVAAAARRGQRRPPASGRGPIRWVAAVLVGAIVGAVLFDVMRGLTGTAPNATAAAADAAARRPAVAVAAAAPPAVTVVTLPAQTGPRPALTATSITTTAVTTAAHTTADQVPAWARDAPGGTHRVTAGDNLWDIAEQRLGDPHRWREIYVLNRGHVQANGYALTDPDEIHIGWTLALPAHDPAPDQPDAEPAAPANPAPTDTGPAVPTPGGSATASPSGPASPAPTTPAPSTAPTAIGTAPGTAAPTVDTSADASEASHDQYGGVTLPSQSWISLGLAATIAALAALLRLHRRRHARLGGPILVGTGPTRPPVPPELALADAAGRRDLTQDTDPERDPAGSDASPRPGARPVAPALPAPIGVDASGTEVSLFDLPGIGLALRGAGAEPVARAVLASALATGVYDPPAVRPVVVTTPDMLARLLPEGAEATGLDPHGVTFDGERLIVLADTAAAVTHAEEEMIGRRRLLDTVEADSIAEFNTRDDHIEHQPPYVLLIDGAPRHAGRVAAVAAHRSALHLHPVVLGDLDGARTVEVTADGTVADGGRFATLAASELAQLITMVAASAARPEPGTDIDEPAADTTQDAPSGQPVEADEMAPATALEPLPDLPAASGDSPPLVHLTVLGPVTATTEAGPVTTGMRSGSYAALALLAAHPHGRKTRRDRSSSRAGCRCTPCASGCTGRTATPEPGCAPRVGSRRRAGLVVTRRW